MKKIAALLLLCSTASAVELPNTLFAERFPPESITTEAKAQKVIEAYEAEIKLLKDWRSQEDKACYREFFVNSCLDTVRRTFMERSVEARQVWVSARDFQRKTDANAAKKQRLRSIERQKQREAEREVKAPNDEKDTPPVEQPTTIPTPIETPPVEAASQKRRLTPEQEQANERAFEQKQKESQETSTRRLTPQQEAANEAEYRRRLAEAEERKNKAQQGKPNAPSASIEEREAERAKRRAAAEQKRLENIRKRAAKAADYERQVKLRQERNGSLLNE